MVGSGDAERRRRSGAALVASRVRARPALPRTRRRRAGATLHAFCRAEHPRRGGLPARREERRGRGGRRRGAEGGVGGGRFNAGAREGARVAPAVPVEGPRQRQAGRRGDSGRLRTRPEPRRGGPLLPGAAGVLPDQGGVLVSRLGVHAGEAHTRAQVPTRRARRVGADRGDAGAGGGDRVREERGVCDVAAGAGRDGHPEHRVRRASEREHGTPAEHDVSERVVWRI
mmetsp:Transcript_9561/g.37277  ORF Transcript_9561/g.37277 Transcript_9561/m.37277 type:complete len:228 (-) Transcript_9561:33-716(-)